MPSGNTHDINGGPASGPWQGGDVVKDSSPSAPPSIPVMGPTGDWTPEQLEEAGRRVLETVRRHLEGLEETPVLPDVGARDLMELLDDPLPQQPEDFDDILQDTEEK